MKKYYKNASIITLISLLFFISCGDDPAPSLWPPPDEDVPAPVISLIEPTDYALAGVSTVTVTGENFSTNPDVNKISFNGFLGEILSATQTQLQVKVPLVISDSVAVKVSTSAEPFSNIYIYKLIPPAEIYYPFDANNNEIPLAITFDQAGNLLVALEGRGIYKITPNKEFSQFIPKGAETKWEALRIFSNGDVYATKSIRGVWKLNEGVTPPNQPWGLPPVGTFLKDFDFDINTNLWVLNSNNFIFRFKQDQSVSQYSFNGALNAVRVFDNYLYVAGSKSEVEGVWKIPIDSNGDLGQEELYFNLTDNYTGVITSAMTFSHDGDLYLGTNKTPDPIIIVHPDGTHESLYPGVLDVRGILSMYWPEGNHLFITRSSTGGFIRTVLRIDMEKPGAIYYNQ